MSLPREPRQKMINMMYLVLTALLALNVSSEILNAFKTVNKSLETTNATVSTSTQSIVSSLKQLLNDPQKKDQAAVWYPKAQQLEGYSKNVYDYIQSLKAEIIKDAGGDINDPTKKFKEESLDIATRIMVEKGAGKKLFDLLTKYKQDVLAIDPKITAEIGNSLPMNLEKPESHNKAGKTWEGAYFHMVPTVAALTILSKFQNDVRTSENKVMTKIHEQVGKVEVVFDSYAAVVGQSSSYVTSNEDVEITAGIGAFSKQALPTVSIGGRVVPLGEDGAAHLKIPGGSVGAHSVPVTIVYTDQKTGEKKTVEKKIEYVVGTSSAAVQLDKMNVLFIGVANPVTVSGSGNSNDMKVSMSGGGGSISAAGGKGAYIARVNQETDECYINVTTSDGTTSKVKFRVRSIPDPTPRVGTYKGGDIPAAAFKAQAGINAIVENFFYETQFNVTSFYMTGDGEGFENFMEANNSGAAWGGEASAIVRKARAGSLITLERIKAVGPDGRTRTLPPILFNLK